LRARRRWYADCKSAADMRAIGAEWALHSARQLRLVLQCRELQDRTLCENLAFAFARDAGLRGLDVWCAAACAVSLASHALACGGGEVELSIVDEPRPALQMIARCGAPSLGATPPGLRAAEQYADELRIEWVPRIGSVITAHRWLRGRS
jgi:hypothetical protein